MAFSEITVQEASELLAGPHPPRLVDCREPEELAICKLEGSELIPFPTFMQEAPGKLTDHSEPILILCHHGVRSAYAAEYLAEMGYDQVRSVRGGIEAWAQEIDPSMPRY